MIRNHFDNYSYFSIYKTYSTGKIFFCSSFSNHSSQKPFSNGILDLTKLLFKHKEARLL